MEPDVVSMPLAVPRPRLAAAGLALWGIVALAASASGLISLERRLLVPIGIALSVATLLTLYFRSPSFRALADGVDLRVPILFHTVRAPIGLGFLVLMTSGLDAGFARIAGYGDIVSGVLAGLAAVAASRPGARSRALVRLWNALALLDILVVVATAQRIILFSGHPESMSTLLRFPFAIIPLFVVPLVIATHLLVFRRTSAGFQA